MNVTELKAKLKAQDPSGWFVICGEEEYLKRYYRNEIKKLITSDTDPFALFNHSVFDGGADFDVMAFIEAVKSPPMMSDHKLIEWQFADLGKLKEKELSKLADLAAAKEDYPYATVVISALPDGFDQGTPKKPTKLYKTLAEGFEILNFEKSSDAQLLAWISKHFAAEGITASREISLAILMRVGHSMQALSFEIDKLCAYAKAHDKKEIDLGDVSEICSSSIESDAFAISNAIIEKNTEKAFLALLDMKMQRVDPGAVLAQLSKTYAELMSVALFSEEGKSAADTAVIMKFHPYKLGLYMTAAKKLGSKKIAASLSSLIKTDSASKSGGISGYEAIEIFITQNIGR